MNDTTFQGDGSVKYVPVVVDAKQKPITNADAVRAMTDEELANFLARQQICAVLAIYKAFDEHVPDAMTGAREEWLDWLRQEALP